MTTDNNGGGRKQQISASSSIENRGQVGLGVLGRVFTSVITGLGRLVEAELNKLLRHRPKCIDVRNLVQNIVQMIQNVIR